MATQIHIKRKKRSKRLEKLDLHIGHPFHRKELDAVHVGMILAAENALVLFSMVILSILTAPYLTSWAFLLLVSPLAFVALWAWFTQSVLHEYNTTTLHEALLIAKLSVFPFMVFMLMCAIGAVGVLVSPTAPYWLLVALYNGAVGALGTMLLGLTLVGFGLRHRIRIEL